MSIAEKLTTIAENMQKVYDAGKAAADDSGGYDEGYADGQQAEYDRFWDAFQNNNGHYYYAFSSKCWTDEIYNPKKPIVCTTSAESVYRQSRITTTKVPIEIRGCIADSMFRDCPTIKEIPYLGFFDATSTSTMFTAAYNLESITVDGLIETGVGFAPCSKLNNESVESIIEHLADLTGKTSMKVTFHADILAKLTEAQLAEIQAKNWTLG